MWTARRVIFFGLPLLLGACAQNFAAEPVAEKSALAQDYMASYRALEDEPFAIPAVDLKEIDPKYLRRGIDYSTAEPAGTIVVDPNERFLYLVLGQGKAIRYGVGVGRTEAFNFRGRAVIGRKAEWPSWRPTSEMIARDPARYAPLKEGMPGGSGNPLGPRALYLYRNGRDTHYRLHGTTEPWTIGTKVSSGCVRLLNQDIVDIYRRVPVGARVVVLPATSAKEAPSAYDRMR